MTEREKTIRDMLTELRQNVRTLESELSAYEWGEPIDVIWMVPDTGVCFHRNPAPGAFAGGGPLSADAVQPGDVAPRDGRGVYARKTGRDEAIRYHLDAAKRSVVMFEDMLREAKAK